jgi:E1A/CREB-binding protein
VFFASSVRALGIINKMITGPFWRLIEKVGNVLDLNPHLVALQVKFKELASDASPLLRGETIFFVDINLHKDEIFAICSTRKLSTSRKVQLSFCL